MKIRLCLTILIWLLLYTGCGLHTAGVGPGYAIWLDAPMETETTAGTVVAISVHANYELSEVTIGYNLVGQSSMPYRTIPMTLVNSSVYEGTTIWTPLEPGEYNLRAYSSDGIISVSRYIKVLPATEERSYPTPTPLTLPMTAETPSPTTTLPAILPSIQFSADTYDLPAGGCTFLRWSSVYVEKAYLNGEPVELMHSRQVCPASTTTYTLRGESSGGSMEETVTINVTPTNIPTTEVPVIPPPVEPPSPTPDVQGPNIAAISKSVESIYDGTTCGVASNTINASITDPSGVSEVVLWYRASKNSPAKTGEWRSIAMTKTSGNSYQALLGVTQLTSSLTLYTDGTVEFYIIAKDGIGNTTQSGTLTFVTILCLG